MPHDTGDAVSGKVACLGRDLPFTIDVRSSAVAGVLAFTILANEKPVNVLWSNAVQARRCETSYGACIYVQLHWPTHF